MEVHQIESESLYKIILTQYIGGWGVWKEWSLTHQNNPKDPF